MTRLAVVTGGARGIGYGIVRALLEQDVVDEVAVLDRDPTAIAEAKGYECAVPGEAWGAAGLAALGAVPQVLVNNAGGERVRADAIPFDPFHPAPAWRGAIHLNLTSGFIVTRAIAPQMTRGASICNTASIAGVAPNGLFAYGAAKAALIHWSKSLAAALAPQGIRVNAVAPGFIYTRLWQQLVPTKEMFDQIVRGSVPMGTEQTVEDIADAVAFLCSERAAQITGQVLAIDGGT